DVTERRQVHDLTRLQCDLAVKLNSAADLNAALRQSLDTAIAASGMDSGGVYLVDATGGLELQCHTGLSPRFVSDCAYYGAEAPNSQFVMSGAPVYEILPEIIQELNVGDSPEGLRALAVIPVLHAGQVIACLNIASHTDDVIHHDARCILEGIAAAIGSTISRLRAEEALQDSEALSCAVIENSPVGISIRNAKGELLSVNDAWMKIWGVSPEEVENFINERTNDLTSAQKCRQLGQWFPQIENICRKGGVLNIPELYYDDDPLVRPRWVSLTYYSVTNDRGEVDRVVVLTQDITERKLAEQALQERDVRFRKLSSWVPGMIYQFTRKPDGSYCVPFTTEAIRDIFGCSPEDAREDFSPIVKVILSEDLAKVVDSIEYSAKHLTIWSCEYRVQIPGRPVRWMSGVAAPERLADGSIAWYGFNTDITESKRAEEALRESREILGAVLNAIPVRVFWKDKSLAYLGCNTPFAQDAGFEKPEDVIGKTDYAMGWRAQADLYRADDRAVIERGEAKLLIEEPQTTPSGEQIHLMTSKVPLRDASGEIIGVLGAYQDITERKRAEVALRKSEALLSAQFTNSPDIILIINRNYKIVVINKAPSGRFTAAELVGMDCIEILPPEVRDESRRRVAECFKTGEMQEFEHRLVKGMWVRARLVRIGDGSESDQVMIISADITARKRAEEALHTAEEQYRLLFEGASEGILVAQDGMIVLSNPAWTAISGYSPEEFTLRPFVDFIHPEDREFVADRYRRRISGESTPTNYDFRILTRNGGVRTVRINSSMIVWNDRPATLNFLDDVTARRQSEDEIRKFKTISDNASYGTQIISPQATFLYVNQTYAEMHGYSPDELIGRHVSLCHTEQQMILVSEGIEEVFKSGSFTSKEIWHVHRNGTEFPTLMSGTVIRDREGQPQYLAATTVDITELKHLQELADRAHRLEAAGRIAGQVAHDFNNLLGPLVAYPEIIREELGEGHPVNAYLEPIEIAARQMAEINQQLLTLGRRGHYTLKPLNLNEVIRQVLHQMQDEDANLTVVTNLAGNLMNISGGSAQMSRVMTNLITNAVDAMQGSGTLTITSENWYADESQGMFGQVARGEYAKVTVSDTGGGIPEDVMPHVFEPFFTTKKADRKRGSGLGLSVVHAVVEDHHGYIEIDSMASKGTSIHLYFPITREEISRDDETILSGGNESVLVVDDDAIQREVTLRLLQKLGHRAEAVDGGEAALQRLQLESFDLLILDMVMSGGLDGADTYRLAKELRSDQKAIIVSGFAESDRVAEALRMGAADFIKKPLTLKALAAAVRRELDRKPVAETVV
ncbi:MAG: PAS domain S-box protein, partial [candidate division Zixibacteria bacterium]|nr:PAS domain S-box protein [candidate division Zixibacteria bacterium]